MTTEERLEKLERELARARRRKSPAAAGVLNFLFWGAGYIYAGRAWGWAILVPDILLNIAMTTAEMSWGDLALSTVVFLPISIALGWHAYQMVKEAQDR